MLEDGSGNPVADIKVVLGSPVSQNSKKIQTSADGRFEFLDVADESFSLAVDDPIRVLVDSELPRVTVADSQPIEDLELIVTKGGIVTGRVYDVESGKGIVDLKVDARPYNQGPTGLTRSAKTDSEGHYRIEGLHAGDYYIYRGSTKGYPTAQWRDRIGVTVHFGEQTDDLDFALDRGIVISGKVIDRKGDALANAHIQAMADQGGAYQRTESAKDGSFELMGFTASSQVHIGVTKEGHFGGVPQTMPPPRDAQGVRS